MAHSIRVQFSIIFLAILLAVLVVVILINTTFLDDYYVHSKKEAIKTAYSTINIAANNGNLSSQDFDIELQKVCEKYNIELIVLDADSQTIKTTASDVQFLTKLLWENMLSENGTSLTKDKKILEQTDEYTLQTETDVRTGTGYMEIWGVLGNGNLIMMRTALESIAESVTISNNFVSYVGFMIAVLILLTVFFITKKITDPITDLSAISDEMKALNFEAKYKPRKFTNELDRLGENINELSSTLEKTITELKNANYELQQDIDKKNELDEMRRDFISNVSHELKTPIALIQGYAEGLSEGINDDDAESRQFYCEVIMDEAAKMNNMVKKLLTLNQLEFGKSDMTMERFNIVDMVKNYMKSAEILARQKNVTVRMEEYPDIYVWADEFKTEEILQNYYSNAINHVAGEMIIEIKLQLIENHVRISVFNTGTPIPEDSIKHIWDKFYKVDKARTREYGGSGVGLSIVKAILDSMHQQYGVINYDNGVEFWFELETK
ncbi:MAG: HAMP domain-containing histidine kinase [Butyrivibrio sp.]|nr:HAMP domain-containing histidine kinase [Butyrivibrio sp.]